MTVASSDITVSCKCAQDFDIFTIDRASEIVYEKVLKKCEEQGVYLSQYGNHAGLGSRCTIEDYYEKKGDHELFDIKKIQDIFDEIQPLMRRSRRLSDSWSLTCKIAKKCNERMLWNGDFIVAMILSGYPAHFGTIIAPTINASFKAQCD
jgi:hypothetical protein